MTALLSYFSYVDADRHRLADPRVRLRDHHALRRPVRRLSHAELRLGDASIIVFSDDGQCYGRMTEVQQRRRERHVPDPPRQRRCRRLVRPHPVRRRDPVWKPERTEWGNYRCRVRDVEGYEWSFGIHKPGEPADW